MASAGDFEARPAAWWLALGGLCVLLLLPFLVVDVPPVLDYPNHLARLVVLARGASDPVLSAMYAPNWGIIPNLGLDVVGQVLVAALPVHVAGRILLAGSLLLPFLGAVAYGRAVFGRRRWWTLAGAVFAYNGFFFLGFLNFLYALGLALFGAAAWIRFRQANPIILAAVGASFCGLLFFCHVFGVLYFALLVSAHEAGRLWATRHDGRLAARAAGAAALVGVVLLPAVALYRLSTLNGAGRLTLWPTLAEKAMGLFVPFMTYDRFVAFGTAAVFLSLLVLIRGQCRFDRGSMLAAGFLLAVYAAAPVIMQSGTFVDIRFMLMCMLVLCAGMSPRLSPRAGLAAGAVVVALVVVRVASVGLAWEGHRADLAGLRSAIAHVEPGDRVLVADAKYTADDAYRASEPEARRIPGLFRTDIHRAGLLLIERRAFWPLLFADPRQQPVVVRPPYDAIAFPLGEPPLVEFLKERLSDAERALIAPYLRGWCTRFDYVLVLGAGALRDPRALVPDWLDLVEANDAAALYRIRPAAPSSPPCPA